MDEMKNEEWEMKIMKFGILEKGVLTLVKVDHKVNFGQR